MNTVRPNRLEELEKKIKYYRFYRPDSALHYVRLGIKACNNPYDFQCLGQMYNHLGIIYENIGKLDSAKHYYLRGITAFKQVGDGAGIANELNRLGVLELRKSDYPSAASHFFRALKIYERNSNAPGIAETYLKIGAVYDRQQNFNTALSYIRRAEKVASSVPFSSITLYVYSGLGNAYFKQGKYLQAANYYQIGVQRSGTPEFQSLNLSMTSGLASCLAKLGQSDKALSMLRNILPKAKTTGLYDREIQILSAMGDAHTAKNPDSAKYYYQQAINKSEFRGDIETAIRTLKALHELHYNHGDYRDAIDVSIREHKLSDSLFNLQKTLQIADLEANHQLLDAKANIEALKLKESAQRTERYGIITICILVLISLLVISHFYLRKRKLNECLSATNSRLQLLNKELDEANQAKDKVFSIIGHDLRSPLAGIIGVLALFKSDLLAAEERMEVAEKLHEQSTAAMALLNNLLNWGQSQLKGPQLSKLELDIYGIVEANIQLLASQLQAKNVSVQNLVMRPTTIFADQSHVDFVIRNLLSNAIKYSFEGGIIVIKAENHEGGGQVTIMVCDQGIGMDSETSEKIFSLGGLSRPGTSGEKGTALGLVISKSFIEANGGSISVNSQLQVGTTFSFTLPKNSQTQ